MPLKKRYQPNLPYPKNEWVLVDGPCWLVHGPTSVVSFAWSCSLVKVVTSWSQEADPPGFHLLWQDQIYCLVPEAPHQGNADWAKNFWYRWSCGLRPISRSKKALSHTSSWRGDEQIPTYLPIHNPCQHVFRISYENIFLKIFIMLIMIIP